MEFISLAISQQFLKIETSDLDQKFSKFIHIIFHHGCCHHVNFRSHDWASTIFVLKKSANISETVSVRHKKDYS